MEIPSTRPRIHALLRHASRRELKHLATAAVRYQAANATAICRRRCGMRPLPAAMSRRAAGTSAGAVCLFSTSAISQIGQPGTPNQLTLAAQSPDMDGPVWRVRPGCGRQIPTTCRRRFAVRPGGPRGPGCRQMRAGFCPAGSTAGNGPGPRRMRRPLALPASRVADDETGCGRKREQPAGSGTGTDHANRDRQFRNQFVTRGGINQNTLMGQALHW